jgi:hypothetical protein
VGIAVGVGLGISVGVVIGICVAVGVGAVVGVAVGVGVGAAIAVGVAEGTGVAVAGGLAVGSSVSVGVGGGVVVGLSVLDGSSVPAGVSGDARVRATVSVCVDIERHVDSGSIGSLATVSVGSSGSVRVPVRVNVGVSTNSAVVGRSSVAVSVNSLVSSLRLSTDVSLAVVYDSSDIFPIRWVVIDSGTGSESEVDSVPVSVRWRSEVVSVGVAVIVSVGLDSKGDEVAEGPFAVGVPFDGDCDPNNPPSEIEISSRSKSPEYVMPPPIIASNTVIIMIAIRISFGIPIVFFSSCRDHFFPATGFELPSPTRQSPSAVEVIILTDGDIDKFPAE